jgi:hypothetical protein
MGSKMGDASRTPAAEDEPQAAVVGTQLEAQPEAQTEPRDETRGPESSFEEPKEDAITPLVQRADLIRGTALTVPQPGASPFQDRLAAGNVAARATSIKKLADWFPGYDFEEAAQDVDSRRFMVVGLGDALIKYLDGVNTVDSLLLDHQQVWGIGGMSFSHGDVHGHQGPPSYAVRYGEQSNLGRLDPGGLARALDERWTGIINTADFFDRTMDSVCMHLARVYGTAVNTNIYVSYGPSKGFGAHWDNHDTIIVPVRGAKKWNLFEPNVLSAERPWTGPETSEKPLWEGYIEPGMALIIPRGWGHRVDGSDDLSLHYTIGISRLEVHHMIERVAFEAGYWPTMRGDVPFDPFAPAGSYAGSVFDDPQGFARTLAEIATPELIDRAVASHRARILRPVFPNFEDTFRVVAFNDWSGLRVRLAAPSGVMLQAEGVDGAVVALNDHALRVASPAMDAFAALSDCEPWAIEDLPAVTVDGVDARAQLAQQLVVVGMATAEPA